MAIISDKEQLTVIAKRIQTRLSKQSVKVSLSDIKPMCESMIADINNPLPEEMDLVINHFLDNANAIQVTNVPNNEIVENNLDNELPETETAVLANTTQSQLITTTADTMGIVLNASEVEQIAADLNSSNNTFESDIDVIRDKILAFVRYKSTIAQNKISQMVDDVRKVVSEENRANSILLSNGLVSISQDIQEAQKDFKSNVSKALTAFAVPVIN